MTTLESQAGKILNLVKGEEKSYVLESEKGEDWAKVFDILVEVFEDGREVGQGEAGEI